MAIGVKLAYAGSAHRPEQATDCWYGRLLFPGRIVVGLAGHYHSKRFDVRGWLWLRCLAI